MKIAIVLSALVAYVAAVPLESGGLIFTIQTGSQPLPVPLAQRQLKADCGKTSLSTSEIKIVGGVLSQAGENPWQISLRRSGWSGFSHSCGGSIIDAVTIVTAAHCVDGTAASSLQVSYGSLKHASGTTVAIKTVIRHENYDSSTISNDVAILKLASPIPLDGSNAQIGTVCLAASGSEPLPPARVTASGWGTTKSGGSIPADLYRVSVPVVDRATCDTAYTQYGGIDATMICAAESEGGKDSCQGDSGGPLVTIKENVATLVGIVSWGYGCAVKGYPGVYSNVGALRSWIDANRA